MFYNTDIQNEEQLDVILKTKPIKDGLYFQDISLILESPTKVTQSYSLTPFLKKKTIRKDIRPTQNSIGRNLYRI